jgi:transcriptional regulator with XRE-family HTH domain
MPTRETHVLNAQFIGLLCAQRGWSQADLAKAAGIDEAVISRKLKSKEAAEKRTVQKIADQFNLPPHVLYAAYRDPVPPAANAKTIVLVWKVAIPNHAPTKSLLISLISAVCHALGFTSVSFHYEDHHDGSILLTVSADDDWAIAKLIERFAFGRLDIVDIGETIKSRFDGLIFPEDTLSYIVLAFQAGYLTIEQACYLARALEPDRLSIRYGEDGSLHLLITARIPAAGDLVLA